MATLTKRYGLTKPGADDYYDIAVQSDNLDKIDTAISTQIATVDGEFISLNNTLNGGLRVLVRGKLTEVGTGTKSPDNPYVLKGVGESGTVNVTVCGKNLVNIDQSAYNHKPCNISLIKKGTKVFFTALSNVGTSQVNAYATFSDGTNGDYASILNTSATSQVTSVVFSKDVVNIKVHSTDTATKRTDLMVQMEISTVATAYEPYKGNTAPVTFTTPIFDGDTIEKRNGVWGVYRDKMKSVFQGAVSEAWSLVSSQTGTNTLLFKISNSIKFVGNNISLVCNRFPTNLAIWESDTEGITISDTGFVCIRINKSRLASQDEIGLKSWLALNLVIVLPKLANPTWTPLTQAEQAQLNALCTFSGVTNIFTDDALNPTLSVQYGLTDVAALAIYDDNKTDNKFDQSKVSGDLNNADSSYVASIATVKYLNETKAETTTLTATIGTTWTGSAAPYTQTIAVTGVKATDNPVVDVILSSTLALALEQEKQWGYISKITTTDNSITVICNKKKPTVALPIQIKAVR